MVKFLPFGSLTVRAAFTRAAFARAAGRGQARVLQRDGRRHGVSGAPPRPHAPRRQQVGVQRCARNHVSVQRMRCARNNVSVRRCARSHGMVQRCSRNHVSVQRMRCACNHVAVCTRWSGCVVGTVWIRQLAHNGGRRVPPSSHGDPGCDGSSANRFGNTMICTPSVVEYPRFAWWYGDLG